MVQRVVSNEVVEVDYVPPLIQRRLSQEMVEVDYVPPLIQRRNGFLLIEVDFVQGLAVGAGISSAEAFGYPTVTVLLQIVTPTGIPSEEAFGQPVLAGAYASGSVVITGGGTITVTGAQQLPKGINARSTPPLRARRIPPGSLWASDSRISQPQPVDPDKPILKEFGGFGFTADGLRHSLSQADKEQMFQPLYSPEGEGPETDTVPNAEDSQ